jgi:hypothetical protein
MGEHLSIETFFVKLHMTKANDKIEWNFLVDTLSSMRFLQHITTIMKCVTYVYFSIVINRAIDLKL